MGFRLVLNVSESHQSVGFEPILIFDCDLLILLRVVAVIALV